MDRPTGVPPEAVRYPGGEDFAALQAAHRNRRNRGALLRVAFPFAYGWSSGVLLREVGPRGLLITRAGGRPGTWLVFSRDEPVPDVWAWTLAEQRGAVP